MSTQFEKLLNKVKELHDLEKILAVLNWDRSVNMPDAGSPARAKQVATLSRMHHALYTSAEMGDLIEEVAGRTNGVPYDSFEASLVRFLQRDYADATQIPESFITRSTEISAGANLAWRKAREESNYSLFEPWLAQVIELCQELAGYYSQNRDFAVPYDALMDKYEPEAKASEVRAVFDSVKAATVPLLQAIKGRGSEVRDDFLYREYPIDKQEKIARELASAVGYDFDRGHLGTAPHPFATSFTRDDARITTRWYEGFINPSIFGVLHESGHAMYEQGTGEDLSRTPLARGTSLGIHESQSRMMENIVGRCRGFWNAHFPLLQESFPGALGEVNVEQFYRAINKVQPSYIRVEADELTYNLHIILRFELEQEMLNGELSAKDLPAAWNARMESLLGVTPPDDAQGCLQDIHWSRPSFGYFPTYALGNLYAAQLFEAATAQHPEINSELNEGKNTTLVEWLRENIHRHGRKFTPSELVEMATGKRLSHEPFVRYVTNKFTEIYGL